MRVTLKVFGDDYPTPDGTCVARLCSCHRPCSGALIGS